MASTITVQSVVNFASTQTELMPLAGVGGYTNEPALSLANDTLGDLLANYPWKFNRADLNLLVTQQGRQDYRFAGAIAFTSAYGATIDMATNNAVTEVGTLVTVKTLQAHNFSVGDTVYMNGNTLAAYNSTLTQTPGGGSVWSGGWVITAVPSATSFQFTHASSGLGNSGAAGITDVGWFESATMVNMGDTGYPQTVKYLRAVREIRPMSYMNSRPQKISFLKDEGTGIIQVRFADVPGSIPWGVTITYQKMAPTLTSLTSTWAPFPDDQANVYRQKFLVFAYRHIGSAKEADAEARAQAVILAAQQGDDYEESDEQISPDVPLMGSDAAYGGEI